MTSTASVTWIELLRTQIKALYIREFGDFKGTIFQTHLVVINSNKK